LEQIGLIAYGQAEEIHAMTNEEHLARLHQRVKAWNAWRRENPNIRPDLTKASITRTELVRMNLLRAVQRQDEAFYVKKATSAMLRSDDEPIRSA
jgi:hypothetical protein